MPNIDPADTADPYRDSAYAMEFLAISERSLRRAYQGGGLQHAYLGSRVKFRQSWLEAFRDQHTGRHIAPPAASAS